ncbi:hypothetical protein MPTK1_5g19600 [Marchantia polymorpha subsp. ruderalis]|uniref:Uncharacterized protein n=2 Tax=Marchantia polymorpha TaxID=3197 RepID=A0AAF6BK48_MARPO|nr:hypothetical protein MARPO_0134s0018 [Marchantia polymorpha]BBN12382.1 hypothetical protein Mp_5g19600 [Marchantia polymorpha subsp. ruderalis]|eukprot:PTQ29806.1 hypothetical protein MARPO_0134s0018 [Marchantia polymorpha]
MVWKIELVAGPNPGRDFQIQILVPVNEKARDAVGCVFEVSAGFRGSTRATGFTVGSCKGGELARCAERDARAHSNGPPKDSDVREVRAMSAPETESGLSLSGVAELDRVVSPCVVLSIIGRLDPLGLGKQATRSVSWYVVFAHFGLL